MTNPARLSTSSLNSRLRCSVVLLLIGALATMAARPARAQTYQVLHNFMDQSDGATPNGLAIDSAGHLYGTTLAPGSCFVEGCGGVFRLTHTNSGWIFNSLYHFQGGSDGSWPHAVVTVASDGTLYGTTTAGGGGAACNLGEIPGCGTVYRLRPPPRPCTTVSCPWQETVIHRFADDPIWFPYAAVTFDSARKFIRNGHRRPR
jgi:hypothetical protein